MSRIAMFAACVFFAAVVAAAKWLNGSPDGRDPRFASPITPEQARKALLQLKELRMISGNENDPIYLDLESGPIVATSKTTIEIGTFVTCDLKANSWSMGAQFPKVRFVAGANGRFERQSDGSWRAIREGWFIS